MLLKTIDTPTGEIAVYRDDDGYHAERWHEAKQLIVAQSGDQETEDEAIEAVAEGPYCPLCGSYHADGAGLAGYSCAG